MEVSQIVREKTFDLKVPGYRIVERCGGGSTANVYIAIQKSLGRQVALKVILTSLLGNKERINQFIKEGRINATLLHPNIVTIHDVGVTDEYHYISMEYLSYGNLRQRLNEKLELDWVLKITEQIASAMAYAHEKGFIHSDIKPENILFRDENTAMLSDFGIAKIVGRNSQTGSTSGICFGTPRYMSPERVLSFPVGPSSDIYSLGVVLFEMLTGKKPYDGKDSGSILSAHVQHPIPRLPVECHHLQPLVNKMLAKHPTNRFNNARDLANELAQIRKEERFPLGLKIL